jgi:hypothetical protein
LRALGFDTTVFPGTDLHQLIRLSQDEGRIILTRNRKLEAKLFLGHILVLKRNQPDLQVRDVLQTLSLSAEPERFLSRCLRCNEMLESVPRREVEDRVPEFVFHSHEVFHRCPACHRIYWEGSHPVDMRKKISELLKPVRDLPT